MKHRLKHFTAIAMVTSLLMAAPHAYSAQAVNVRAGIHDRYNRIVFDWPSKVEFKLSQNNGFISIQFSSAATAQFKSVTSVNPPLIRNIAQQMNGTGLLITFQIPQESKIESFRTDKGVAFDVLHMNKSAPKFSDAPATAPVQEPVAEKEPEAATPPAKTEEVKAEPVAQTPIPEKPAEPVATNIAANIEKNPRFRTLADQLAGKPPEKELEKKTDAPKSAEVVDGTVIRLSPDALTRLAVFTRAGKLWLVLDKPLNSLTPQVQGEHAQLLSQNARRVDVKDASAFVFDAPTAETRYAIRRLKNEWQIWMDPTDNANLPDDMSVNVAFAADTLQPSVSLYAGENPGIISITDSSVGDRLWVVPVRSPEGRISKMRTTPDYQMLPTLMGAVIVPQSDAVKIEQQKNMVVISSDKTPLQISTEKDRAQGIKDAKFVPMFDLHVEQLVEGSFNFERQQLETRLIEKKTPAKKSEVLLDMARLNISHGFGPEATGILRIAKAMTPDIATTREYQALQGMAAALAGDMAMVKNTLAGDTLQSQPAANLWRAYTLAQHYQWPQARAAFIESGSVINSMPEYLKPRLILAQAETALMVNDIADVDQQLKKITKETKLLPSEQAAYEYIKATAQLMAKDTEDSIPAYQELVKGRDQLYKVKAQLALTNQQVLDKTIKLDQAIKNLERLRFEWRNDRLEIDILRKLGQYYIDNKQYMEGLSTWRQAASLSKNTEDTDAITEAMQKVFSDLYVAGNDKDLNPLQSVALFERFRELTPSGDAGNTALMHLADRLAAVDLLDQADALLEKQLLHNATGEQAAKLGSKLASWRLLNHNPSGALKALDESTQDGNLPESLSQKRLLLRAKSLGDLNRTDEALTLLNTMQSPESYSLKADINWRQNRWGDAVESLQPLVNLYRDEGKTAIDGPMPALILKMAISMSLDDNRKGLELLSAQYGEYMSTTSSAQAFGLITKPSGDGALADLDTIRSQVGEVDLFQTFLKDFSK